MVLEENYENGMGSQRLTYPRSEVDEYGCAKYPSACAL